MDKNSRFVVNGNGTVTDTTTGLMWQQGPAGSMTWEVAISYCKGLSLGGHDDWRLPTINELQSLVDYTCHYPAIDTVAFPCTIPAYHWSSTTFFGDTRFAWCVGFGNGILTYEGKSNGYCVRAVRGGQGE